MTKKENGLEVFKGIYNFSILNYVLVYVFAFPPGGQSRQFLIDVCMSE